MAASVAPDDLNEECGDSAMKQEQIVEELQGALIFASSRIGLSDDNAQFTLAQAVETAVKRYREHFQSQSGMATRQPHSTRPSLHSATMRRVFLWMGGQRPSISLQLLYALMGHQIQVELEQLFDLGRGADERLASLASLSASQLNELNELQAITIKEEDHVDEETATIQQSLADQPIDVMSLIDLDDRGEWSLREPSGAQDAANMGRCASQLAGVGNSTIRAKQKYSTLRQKVATLKELQSQAENLRFSTLEGVLGLLHTPYQKAQYLLAFSKLNLALYRLSNSWIPRQQTSFSKAAVPET